MPEKNFDEIENNNIKNIFIFENDNNDEDLHDNIISNEKEEFLIELYDKETSKIILENMLKYIEDNNLYLCKTLTQTKIETLLENIYKN